MSTAHLHTKAVMREQARARVRSNPVGLPWDGSMGQQLEDQRGGDLVWDVRHAYVKVGQVHLEEVTHDEFQLVSIRAGIQSERGNL